MRRNNRGGNRMGNRGMGNQNSGGPRPLMGNSGPMMTDSLQLRELDLELELLKRKRQMIEEQHGMLTDSHAFNRGNQFGYQQQSQSFGQPSRNFGSLYPESGGSRRGYGGPQGNKRPAIDPWDNSAPSPKRFGGSQPPRRKPNQGFRDQRPSRPQPANRAPFRGAARQDDKFSKPRNLQSKGVTKAKQNAAPPNKLKSLPAAERKNLVEKASDLVLAAEGPVHPKLAGRLELALGSIIREMREPHGTDAAHADTFALGGRQRALKAAIRDRLRQVMLGKTVGLNAEIIQIYRTTYPKETDLELLESIRETNKPTSEIAIKLVRQGKPEKYFKHNFARLLSVSLTEMFERLKMLYAKEIETKKPLHEVIQALLAELDESIPEEEKQKLVESLANGTQEAEKPAVEETSQAEGENAAAQEETNNDEETVPEETSGEAEASGEAFEENTDDNVASAEAEQKPEESAEPKETQKLNTSTASADGEKATERTLMYTTRFYQRLIETYLRKNLPVILPKYKEYIVDILNSDEAFKKTEAYIIKTTNEKAKNFVQRDNKTDEKAGDAGKKTTTPTKAAAKEDKSGPKPGSRSSRHQYFAKVIGRPALPKKQIMKVFLDEFEPTLIKKHRNIHNILFISFDKKENYDNILSRNGHTLDSRQLEIKPSEKINRNAKEQQQEAKKEADSKQNESKEPVDLGSLDDQIDELLTTIQEEDGEAQENGVAEVAEETGNEQEGMEENAGNEELQKIEEQNEAMDAQDNDNTDYNQQSDNNWELNTEDIISEQAQYAEDISDQTESNADQAEYTDDTSSQVEESNEPEKVAPVPKTTRAAAKVAPSTPARGPAAAKTAAAAGTPAKAVGTPAKAVGTPAKTVGTPAKTVGTPAKAVGTPAKAVGTPAKTVGTPAATTATVRTRRASKLTQN